ncbi:MAG: helix-turn-helix transcriptional regulator, partial [Candidatus Binatia bacterium]
MPRGDQVARLYALVMELARSKHGLPVERLASKRGWRPRTVYRDLHALESAGFPITRADGARWKLIDGWEARIPFPMPVGELLALHVARSLMAPLRGTPLARSLDALYERLTGPRSSAAAGQGELFPRFRSVLATRSDLAIDYSKHEAVLETLCRACENRATVRAVYFVETRGEVTRRRIDPYSLYYDPHLEALYVFAWCHLRKAMRTFAVHRFRQAAPTERHFEVPADFTTERYLRGAFRIWRGENAVRVRLLLDREVAGWVTERRWHG